MNKNVKLYEILTLSAKSDKRKKQKWWPEKETNIQSTKIYMNQFSYSNDSHSRQNRTEHLRYV